MSEPNEVNETQEDSLEESSEQDQSTTEEESNTLEEWSSEKSLAQLKKLRAENKRLRERAKSAEEQAGDTESLSKTNEQLSTEVDKLATQVLKYEVAYELGLPKQLVNRLSGGTKEEMLEDAESLLGLFQKKTPPTDRPSKLRGGSTPDQGERSTADQFADALGGYFS